MPRDRTPGLPSDEELARRAQRGCSASFEELARRFQVPLLQFLGRWSAREDAEDLVQDTLVRAYRNLHRYRDEWRFATWLFTIARRLSINHQRRRRPRTEILSIETAEDGQPGPARRLADKESRQRLWGLAGRVLTEAQLTATWLYYVENLPIRQIGRILGRSEVAAKAMLSRARKRLLTALRESEPDGPARRRDGESHTMFCRAAMERSDG